MHAGIHSDTTMSSQSYVRDTYPQPGLHHSDQSISNLFTAVLISHSPNNSVTPVPQPLLNQCILFATTAVTFRSNALITTAVTFQAILLTSTAEHYLAIPQYLHR
jgi:hypothetical protein